MKLELIKVKEIKIAINDADKTFLVTMQECIKKIFIQNQINCQIKIFSSGIELMNYLKLNEINLIYLETAMPDKAGFKLHQKLFIMRNR